MRQVRVAAAAINQTPMDWDGNIQHIQRAILEAKRRQASVLCLPELCLTGYGCEDAFLNANTIQYAIGLLPEIIEHTDGLIVSIGLPFTHQGTLYNTACMIADGQVLGFAAKQNLAGDGLHYEPRWFRPWPRGKTVEVSIGNARVPFGDVIFHSGDLRIGFEICEDAWVENRPGRALCQRGVDLIMNPSASHFAFGKHAIRRDFVLAGSDTFQVAYLYANLLGNEAGRAIYDGDCMIACCGDMLATGPRLSFEDVLVTDAVIDVDAVQSCGNESSPKQTAPASIPDRLVQSESDQKGAGGLATPECGDDWQTSKSLKFEEFTRAEAIGLFDYMRKSRSCGFVVSLSGGADSSAVACLVAKMVEFGVAELGIEDFKAKLRYYSDIQKCQTEAQLVQTLLTCVYQSTRNSSSRTREAAEALANGVHAQFHVIDVDGLVQNYVGAVSEAVGRELSWETDDLALQNIQARVRGPSVWMLANIQGALLVATSNRSEAAVGYATMDGDTCGGLSPIAGIDKAFLRRWLQWMETDGPIGATPIPSLQYVNAQTPTAELRPQSAQQTDESDLMPYEVLDSIERCLIRDKCSLCDTLNRLRVGFPETSVQQLIQWIERFCLLWSRNQWKRERYAPSFHLDDENLDPKTWCRYPILSGGFARELEALRVETKRLVDGNS